MTLFGTWKLGCVTAIVATLVACSSSSPSTPQVDGLEAPAATDDKLEGDGAKESSSSKEKSETTPKESADKGEATDDGEASDDDNDDNGTADDQTNGGGGSRVAVNEHCCFNGRYLRCPNANACLGGNDVAACVRGCGLDADCFRACADEATHAGPPVGCKANVPEPKGVDCANGTINL